MTLKNQDHAFGAGSDYILTIDVTGMTAPRTIVSAVYSVMDKDNFQVLFQKTIAAGITVIAQPPNAQLQVTFIPADTRNMAGEFRHQLRITDDLGKKAPPIMDGILTLEKAN